MDAREKEQLRCFFLLSQQQSECPCATCIFGRAIVEAHKSKPDTAHYEIIGFHTKEVMGCTVGEAGKADVLAEEPDATFREVMKKKCSSCGKRRSR